MDETQNKVQEKVFDIDNIPEDAQVFSSKPKEYKPLEEDTYQVEVAELVLKENPFYKEPAEGERSEQSKYQFSFTYIILDEGEFRGRRIWDTTSLSLKPTTKRGKGGATKLHKILTRAMKKDFDWDMCASFAPDVKTLYRNLLDEVKGHQIKVTIENTVNPDTQKTRSKPVSYSVVKKDLKSYDPAEAEAKHDEDFESAMNALAKGE